MDALFVPIANAVGASVDQIKLIICLLVTYPLGSVFIRVPSSQPALRHLFNISVALFFLLPVLQLYGGILQLLASILGTYTIARFHTGSSMPWVVFILVMGHLLVNHIIRAIYNYSYETVDITGPQMVLTMKMTTFAWNVYDSRRSLADLDAWQAKTRVKRFPSLLEFVGYAFYFPGVLVGPYLEFNDYLDLVNETVFKGKDVKKDGSGRLIPAGRKRVAYKKMFMGIAYLGLFAALGGSYNFSVALLPEFAQKGFVARVLLFQLCGVMERVKYYALWTLTEGASILTGLGFSGFSPSGASQWDGAANIIPLNVEFPSNFKTLLDAWNMKANVWLRECIYKRVTPKGKKAGFTSTILTALTSAVWHGISAGYYMTFLLGGFITSLGRMSRGSFRPLVLQASPFVKTMYNIAGTLATILLVNYASSPFMLLSLKSSIQAWTVLGWYGHGMLVAGFVFFYGGGSRYCRKLQLAAGAKVGSANGHASGTSTPVNEKSGFSVAPVDAFLPAPQK